ncbi:hypothetical protein HHI36_012429 [Cryptolaemus montrouzieri]|uniref:ABC-type xenobiotic transporter n=1 Tax=Cryptolaemus montrouzieri TaxID=559131 RepID=A0ABD2NE72_9CUCU
MENNIRKSKRKIKRRMSSFEMKDTDSEMDNDSQYGGKRRIKSFVLDTDEEPEVNSIQKKPEEETKVEEDPNIPYWKLYSYATPWDWLCILIGLACSIANALCMVYFCLLYAIAVGTYVEASESITNTTISPEAREHAKEEMKADIFITSMQCVGIGLLTILCHYIGGVMFSYSSLRQIFRIRQKFLEKMLIQDVGWYDMNRTGDFATTFSENLTKIEDGIGEKVMHFVYFQSIFIAGTICAFVMAWKMTLICCVSLPLSIIIMGIISWISNRYAAKESESFSEAGSIAEEVFSSIRTVIAFEGQKKELKRYVKPLQEAKTNNVKKSLLDGIANGSMWFFVYAGCSASFYFGVQFIIEDRSLAPSDRTYDAEMVIMIFSITFVDFWMFSMGAPYLQVFGSACGAASKVFKVLNSVPRINDPSKRGLKLKNFKGDILFDNVHFRYPSRKDVKILNGITLRIKAGETVAFVGSSGSGKSTCIQLLQRFYDPVSGEILLDKSNIKDVSVPWLRSKIGIVGQEPALFATTISENIRYGKLSASQEDIERAAKKANVHKFIKSLPNGYETIIGERGTQLSGGQKQRIAIARALVGKPTILLLDEATSALDTTSEAEVQAALDSVSKDSTTIIVAHRLSTVRNADRIIVFSHGKIIEEGSYQNLIDARGAFYDLVKTQGMHHQEDHTPPEEENFIVKSDRNSTKGDYRRESYIDVHKFKHRANESDELKLQSGCIFKVFKKNKPEWFWLFVGCVSSLLIGCVLPTYSILYGELTGVLSLQDNNLLMDYTKTYCLYYLLLGIVAMLLYIIQIYAFGLAGENLTLRMRTELFVAMLKQEVGWFDRAENSVGALCTRLSSDSGDIQGASGMPVGIILLSVCTTVLSNGFALIFQWKLALVLGVFVPFIFIAVFYEQKILQGDSDSRHKELQKSAGIAVEAINNIRTVASLGCERVILSNYTEQLTPYINSAKKQSHFSAFMLGIAKSILYFSFASGASYGAKLIADEGVHYSAVVKVCELVIYGTWALGNAFAFIPNLQKGIQAAERTFTILEREPEIKNIKHASKKPWETGNIEYSRVYFSYPTRPDIPILRGLDLQITAGKTIALVGSSGCGKSTTIQLLERYYNPTAGEVGVDDTDINVMDLQHLRSQFAIVSQEPNLFDRTVTENIAYGINHKSVAMSDIVQAAKDANIHEFISSLPLGYDTRLGSKGTQLSGGQKQRIAIARALIRNPKVLLLDEATSALDNESEKIVQEALDRARKHRTCITIAHRLTTIKDADIICVLNKGKVVEIGRHQELIDKGGYYYEFYKLQTGVAQ